MSSPEETQNKPHSEPEEKEGQRFIGEIVGFHGLRGDVKVKASSDNPDWLKTLKKVTWVRGKESLELEIIRARKKPAGSVILAFANYKDRTQVEKELAHGKLYALNEDLPQPDEDEGEYWASDLVGLKVMEQESEKHVGTVVELLSSAGTDFLEIKLLNHPKTLLIPFIDEFFPELETGNDKENTENAETEKSITMARLNEFIELEILEAESSANKKSSKSSKSNKKNNEKN